MTTTVTTGTTRSADGTTIAFERSGTGPPLVLVDGATCYRQSGPLRPLASLLAAHFTVFVYDRRGRGESADTLPYAVEREVEDLAAVIGEAGGRAAVFGVSSGALLALRAAAAGVPIERLAVFEPPIGDDDAPTSPSPFTAELTRLVGEGRSGDAVRFFMTDIGVPDEIVSGMAGSPAWPLLEAIAPTLVYDATICDTTTRAHVAAVVVPTLVLDSAGSSADLTAWSAAVLGALPDGTHRSLEGQWHQVPDDVLAPVLVDFLRPR